MTTPFTCFHHIKKIGSQKWKKAAVKLMSNYPFFCPKKYVFFVLVKG